MTTPTSKVYIQVDSDQNITRIEGGYTTPSDLTDWILIDEGYGDKYNLCQAHYFDDPIYMTNGLYRYKYVDGAPVAKTQEELAEELEAKQFPFNQKDKLNEISTTCKDIITAGMDVETTEGTEHFSLAETDQINLSTALSAIEQGAKGYPYHADKKLCRMFTAVEIQAIAQAATAHKLYHTTLCNHLLTLVRQATTTKELEAIIYSADCLPTNLQENLTKIIAATK